MMMRFLIPLLALGLSLGTAAADQFDPVLESLFEDLKAGRGDPDALAAEIEGRWLAPQGEGLTVLVERIITAIDGNHLDKAEALADQVTVLAPNFAEGFVLQAQLAFARDDFNKARNALRRAVRLEPRHFVALELLGDLELMRDDKEAAHRRYREALEWNPQLDELRVRADRLRTEIVGREI